jgi:endonuclease/exonuclease/phosphatase family metal-dependent hydrolase
MSIIFLFVLGLISISLLGAEEITRFRLMTFNILQGGGNAKNVGIGNELFGGSRIDEIASAIKLAEADVVGIQEDCSSKSNVILNALGDGWYRAGKVYSKFPAQLLYSNKDRSLEVVDVELAGLRVVRIVNCHWWPNNYGPFLAQEKLRADPQVDLNVLAKIVEEKGARRGGTRGYKATIEPLEEAIEEKRAIFLLGDFNEPSHLDWTEYYAKNGPDRWVDNPTGIPLRLPVRWPGSVLLENVGMVDSFRQFHADEVKKPGNTWTPPYPKQTPGRRPYRDQVLDRIDRVYHHRINVKVASAQVVGEKGDTSDIVIEGRWASDHRAVVIEYKWKN